MGIPLGINTETVQGMRMLAGRLNNSEETMKTAMASMNRVFEDHKDKVGVYRKGIMNYAEELEGVESEFLKLSAGLRELTLSWASWIEEQIASETGGGSGPKKALGSMPNPNANREESEGQKK